jgi:glycerol-3-phosphate O-acyltransferase
MSELAPIVVYPLVGLLLLAAAALLGRRWLRGMGRQTVLRFRARLDRFKFVSRHAVRSELIDDPIITAAIDAEAAAGAVSRNELTERVDAYIEEIVPFFNVLSYYRIGFAVAKRVIRLFYRVEVTYQDEAAVVGLPRRDVVVYIANHRSNMDYAVLTYVLAGVVSISYAVGEWARTWPLEHLFKSFGSYFIRRGFRDPLYHAVLARYVQLVTRNGVTQGIFPEGGLTRDGTLRPPKIGLLDYLLGTLRDPRFEGDIWIVPVGVNYDRVLEDRTLTRELIPGARRPWRVTQLAQLLGFLLSNAARLMAGQASRYGRVGLRFGTPVSARSWFARHAPDAFERSRPERLAAVQQFANELMRRVGAVVPPTAVPIAAAALLASRRSVIDTSDLLERVDDLRRQLGLSDEPGAIQAAGIWDRAWATFRIRRFVIRQGGHFVVLPGARPLLEYYANSIRHLLPDDARWELSPVTERESPALLPNGPPAGPASRRHRR